MEVSFAIANNNGHILSIPIIMCDSLGRIRIPPNIELVINPVTYWDVR
jgi:hypothetical protein